VNEHRGLRSTVWRGRTAWALSLALALGLSACGGGSSVPVVTEQALGEKPATTQAASRFLTQATFGPTASDIDRVNALGYEGWIEAQFNKPRASSYRATWEAADAAAKAIDPKSGVWQDGLINAIWKQALTGPDQLRQRTAYALSQLLVVSMQDGTVGDNPRGAASYADLLADRAFGNYRELLEAVALHPMMGVYLSHLKNQKASASTGRVPDENFAREVMQLFTIGLVALNTDGSVKTAGGQPIATYTPADVAGLARVFTGWSWACPDAPTASSCFFWGSNANKSDADRTIKPMVAYPAFHSPEEKRFLGTVIPAGTSAEASLKTALDTLFNHPNVGPFIGKQLIQRLVTSNPSPAYVSAVAGVFNNNGAGVRGDMKAVLRAILLNPEARSPGGSGGGKLREPVLKLSAFLRAFPHASDSGDYKVGNTDNPGNALGQSPMRSPSVFNFYRPGYVPPGSAAAAAGLAEPELQLAHETSVAGYVNFMRDAASAGVGNWGTAKNRRDLQANYSAELALVEQPVATLPTALVDHINQKLMSGAMPLALRDEIATAVGTIPIPARNATGSNQTYIDNLKRARLNAALFLTLASPEYQIQQ
jgi:uncharacterized protein (DUF1800 family)